MIADVTHIQYIPPPEMYITWQQGIYKTTRIYTITKIPFSKATIINFKL